jgi:hypothetical protein
VASVGVNTFLWNGRDESNQILPDGIYRVFLEAGLISTHGDVEIIVSGVPDPPSTANYVQYAQGNYTLNDYFGWEYGIAHTFGADGVLGNNDYYPDVQSVWQTLTYEQKSIFLPEFMNYDPRTASSYQYYYLLAYKHFQFGSGWPIGQNQGSNDPTLPQWQVENNYHLYYLSEFETGP